MRITTTTRAASRATTARAVATTISRSAAITVPVTAAPAIPILTTTRRFSRRRRCSCSIKPRIRLRSLPWTRTTSSTVIPRAYPRQRVPSCSRSTASKARPFSRLWTFRIPTTKSPRVLEIGEPIRRQRLPQRRPSENGRWTLRARRISSGPSMLWDLETSDSAKVNWDFFESFFALNFLQVFHNRSVECLVRVF